MPLIVPFAGVDRRVVWLRATLLGACFLGLLASAPVWLNSRTFPLLPIVQGFPVVLAPWDKGFFVTLLLALVAACWFYRAAVMFFLAASLFAFCEDQNRGQPWFYMYWVMLLLTLLPEATPMAACRWAISVGYIWSGIQKCNPQFFQIVPGWFVAPAATHWHLPAGAIAVLRWAIATAPLVELGIGIALWIPRFRRMALVATVVVHLTALVLLGPLGYNYDKVVWPWNLAMISLVFSLFAQGPQGGLIQTFAEVRRCPPALVIVALYSLLPILSFAGWWDSYFSFTLYAQSQATADIFVTQAFGDRLPPQMRGHVHKLRQTYDPRIQGPYVFDFQTWGFQQLHVPPIFEPRSYRSIYGFLRTWSRSPDDLRMIIGPRAGPLVFYQGDEHWALREARGGK